jgi:hypothetical protein
MIGDSSASTTVGGDPDDIKKRLGVIKDAASDNVIKPDQAQDLSHGVLRRLVDDGSSRATQAMADLAQKVDPRKVNSVEVREPDGSYGKLDAGTPPPLPGTDLSGGGGVGLAGKIKALVDKGVLAAVSDSDEARGWKDLIQFELPSAVRDAITLRNLEEQKIDDGYGDLNLDSYPVLIGQLPNDPHTTNRFTKSGFYDYVRKHFAEFLQTFPRTLQQYSFAPYEDNDGRLWSMSPSPLTAVMGFTLDTRFPPVDDLPNTVSEYGLVVCSEAVSNEIPTDYHWNFTTVHGPVPWGYHPVSGTRQFGLGTTQDGLAFYVRAADRVTMLIDRAVFNTPGIYYDEAVFTGADEYWETFRANLLAFIKTYDGNATLGKKHSKRYDWDMVRSRPWMQR